MSGSFYGRDYSRQQAGNQDASSDRGLSDDYYGTSNQPQQHQSNSNYGSGQYNNNHGQAPSHDQDRPYGSQGYNENNYGNAPQNQGSSYYPQNQGGPSYPQHQQQGQQHQQHYGSEDPANFNNRPMNAGEDERGLMGALAGAGAGGYGGHKMGHGVIGTIGGAYAGHKLEDAYKHHHDQQTAVHQQQQQYPPPQHQQQQQPQHYQNRTPAGNFAASSMDIEVRDGQDPQLIAQARRVDGSLNHSALFLNEVLGNDDGKFVWQRDGGFGHSAREVHVVEGGRLLRAELRDSRGNWKRSEVWLDERIGNQNGELRVDW